MCLTFIFQLYLMEKILIVGSSGQLGQEITIALERKYSSVQVVRADIKPSDLVSDTRFELLDATDVESLKKVIVTHQITQIYQLVATLSATGEQKPVWSWNLNMQVLINTLELAREGLVNKIFWPSSIAVHGYTTPKVNTPQYTTLEPETVYGISKVAGEHWCAYYRNRYGVDVRSIRYPGLIGYKSLPGGGTTDYAVEIFHKVTKGQKFVCPIASDTAMPMMYMDDAVRGTLELMDADSASLSVSTSYNMSGMSFTPKQLEEEIRKVKPEFDMEYQPDFRDDIAKSWVDSIDDIQASKDWGWRAEYGINELVEVMLRGLSSLG